MILKGGGFILNEAIKRKQKFLINNVGKFIKELEKKLLLFLFYYIFSLFGRSVEINKD